MCEPTTIAMAAMAVAGAFSAYQSNQQGKYQQAVANQNARMQERNASMQADQARDARARGVIAGEEQRDRARQIAARQATSLAGSGLDISSGTSLDLFAETATLGEYDAQVAENNAAREAFGYDFQSTNSRYGARATRSGGRNARAAGRNQAFGTLLTTGANVASMGMGGGFGGGGGARTGGIYGGGSPGNLYG